MALFDGENGNVIIEKLEVGPLAVNCYVVGDEASRMGMIIDPGAEAVTILKREKVLGLDIKFIVLTHAHFDHIGALKELKEVT
ncbi:MAG: MBL fold metallo-hydrolase, partial [Dehalococcoidales bacterium]|nr:MBL fold metallo-hydrolase [Dehalococcoidales bacterium]